MHTGSELVETWIPDGGFNVSGAGLKLQKVLLDRSAVQPAEIVSRYLAF
jgi:hypothetical protein